MVVDFERHVVLRRKMGGKDRGHISRSLQAFGDMVI